MGNIQASIITIGDELLIGQTIDTNSAWIAQRLNELGIDVQRRVAVGDTELGITSALNEEIMRVELVLITGGLGPTADDITKPLLCRYFGGKLVINERVLAHVKDMFAKRNRPFLDRNMKQAEVPDNCTVLFNKMGTAPGMMFQRDGKIIVAMPGVPFEMMGIMEDEVLPYIRTHLFSDAIVHRTLVTSGEGESFIAEKIQDVEEALPSYIKLAYLPHYGGVKLRLTGRGTNKQGLEEDIETQLQAIAACLGDIVIAMDDLLMESIIGAFLAANNLTLGLAESCTGGYIAHHITQVMGASRYFNGCIVCYQNDIKENILGVQHETIETHGVYSQATVTEMAKGAMRTLKTDYGFAVTGLLSDGRTDERVPVGTVWMAVADKDRVVSKEFHFHYDRIRNKEVAAQMGMLMIWKFINGKIGVSL
jgi:nicotinamide-nucleotide amidase